MGIWLAGWLVDPVMMENLLFSITSTIVPAAAFTWKNVKSVPFLIPYNSSSYSGSLDDTFLC